MAPTPLDRARIAAPLERERERLLVATRKSEETYVAARGAVAAGVGSSFQARSPYPIYLARGSGARVWDADGRELIDYHMGFGAMVIGHAHPRIGQVLRDQAPLATHLGAPTIDALPVVDELRRRFGFDTWRFVNSGTEATMGALRLARAATGRQLVLKILGAYHGHHDAVLVPAVRSEVDAGRLAGMGLGATPPTLQVPFNDIDALAEVLAARGDEIACLFVELPQLAPFPCAPEPRYVTALRELTRRHGVLLVLDEVKTGVTIAAGGASERFGIQPDIVTLAKSMGGGVPTGAIGATPELMERVARSEPPLFGTFNAHALAMAACRATLTEILTPDAYEHLNDLGAYMGTRARAAIESAQLPLTVVDCGAKGGICMTSAPVSDYWEWERRRDAELMELLWLFQLNRGVYMGPVPRMHWSLSISHTRADVDRFAENLAVAGSELAA